jgi:TolB protein
MARTLLPGQRAELVVADVATGALRIVYSSDTLLFEAPNWTPDGRWLVVNGDGRLFRLAANGSGEPEPVDLGGVPEINNDHVVAPDGEHVYVSAADGHIHRVGWSGAAPRRVTAEQAPEREFRHYLHGVSPDGGTLAYVGTESSGQRRLYTRPVGGGADTLVGDGFSPADGPEFGPDGEWLYFNSEIASAAPGHAQLFRVRPDGSGLTQLTDDERVNWFPHVSPDNRLIAYVSFPPGTLGHPENVPVTVRLMGTDGSGRRDIASVFGGQGTMNVGSWAPDSRRFAFVAYPG